MAHQLVVAVLRLVNTLLKWFGIASFLAFAPRRIPLLTNGTPPRLLLRGLTLQRSAFGAIRVFTLHPRDPSGQVVVAIHGGAYVGESTLFHWWTYAAMARDTGATVIAPHYPLAPQGTAATVVPEITDFISKVVDDRGPSAVSVLGDSAGGGLALLAVQELVRRGASVPGRMVLLAPYLDVSHADPISELINDPLLDVANGRNFGRLWAGGLDPADPRVSPLFGSLDGLPPTAVYCGSLDVLIADALRLRDRVLAEGATNFTFVLRKDLIHDWPIFPFLPDARADRRVIYRQLRLDRTATSQ